jgi:hypothetical protein
LSGGKTSSLRQAKGLDFSPIDKPIYKNIVLIINLIYIAIKKPGKGPGWGIDHYKQIYIWIRKDKLI